MPPEVFKREKSPWNLGSASSRHSPDAQDIIKMLLQSLLSTAFLALR